MGLVLKRKKGQKLYLYNKKTSEEITIFISDKKGPETTLVIEAPQHISIKRKPMNVERKKTT